MKHVQSLDQVGRDSGERSLSIEEFASLPWPSAEQVEGFVEHVCDAHSWYKHLPLRQGGEFDFFLASDAGHGYTPESPRLHHTWQTTEEYRRRFGFLDYSGPWGRDAGAQLARPPEIIETTRIVLFPYMCRSCNATDACLWSVHAEDVEQLMTNGPQSPSDEDALRWYSSQKGLESMPLSEEESEQVSAVEDRDVDLESLPKAVAEYIRADREAMSVYCELQAKEEAKIRGALSRLHALHQRLVRDWRDRGPAAS
jgi:hypothetical protein